MIVILQWKELTKMKALEEKIVREGKVYPGGILNIGSFLNQRIDVPFMMEMGREIARLYEGQGVNKVLLSLIHI